MSDSMSSLTGVGTHYDQRIWLCKKACYKSFPFIPPVKTRNDFNVFSQLYPFFHIIRSVSTHTPLRGVTFYPPSSPLPRQRFYSYTPAGCNIYARNPQRRDRVSTHTPLRGVTPQVYQKPSAFECFYSYTPAGCNCQHVGNRLTEKCVSTHTPLWGVTSSFLLFSDCSFRFYSYTHTGCNIIWSFVSTHAPIQGAISAAAWIHQTFVYFNPCTRTGCNRERK